ncbi:rhodopsin, GQ-coupled-like [Aplysia californica]|uniref:Rhodopsin, GQ-coupled-like n=1 Tax=Aplysia californica TaxID=6500 RepID=A0ABM0JJW6_APLCA|nr:rhodopsin, GQ-coupled-like [Aplysia californica]
MKSSSYHERDIPVVTTVLSMGDDKDIDYKEGVTHEEYLVIAWVLTLVAVVGTVCNALAVTVFYRFRELRSPTNSFIIALCVCDFFMSCIGTPIPAFYAFREAHITSRAVCILDGFIIYFLACTSIYLLAAISADRYIVIVKPFETYTVTQRAANVAIAICLLLGFLMALMPVSGWNEYTQEGIGTWIVRGSLQ